MLRAGLLIGVVTSLLALGTGCGEDAETPDCPPLPLYDVRVDARRETLRPELTALANKGCITLPKGFESSGDGVAGSGGSGSSGGGSGGDGNDDDSDGGGT